MAKQLLTSLCTVATRKFGRNITVNKFGVHKATHEASEDTGYGFCYRFWSNQTIPFDKYQQNNTADPEYSEITKYVSENSVPCQLKARAKLRIVIENHADPLVQLAPWAFISQDSTRVFDGRTQPIKREFIKRPEINLETIPHQKHIWEMRPSVSSLTQYEVEIAANQWCFLYWKQCYMNMFLSFCSDEIAQKYINQPQTYQFEMLPHAPGGTANGDFRDGADHEYFIEEGATYEIKLIVSPAIKIDLKNSYSRYPQSIYPFLPGKKDYSSTRTDFHTEIHEANVYDGPMKNQWQLEHNFGIDGTFRKVE